MDLLDHALVVHARRLVVASQGHLAGELERYIVGEFGFRRQSVRAEQRQPRRDEARGRDCITIYTTDKDASVGAWEGGPRAAKGDGRQSELTLVFSQMSETESAILLHSLLALEERRNLRSQPPVLDLERQKLESKRNLGDLLSLLSW